MVSAAVHAAGLAHRPAGLAHHPAAPHLGEPEVEAGHQEPAEKINIQYLFGCDWDLSATEAQKPLG